MLSKAIAAQYLSEILEYEIGSGRLSPGALLSGFPPYLRSAIEYVTRPAGMTEGVEKGSSN